MKALLLILCSSILCLGCYHDTPAELPEPAGLAGRPLTAPDVGRGQELFAKRCTKCHGEAGRGGEAPGFRDRKRMENMSPASAYNSMTKGMSPEAIATFALLSDRDRWHLAFYVLSLGHEGSNANNGEIAFRALGITQPTARTLATLSNKAILADLNNRVEDTATSLELLAYLRTLAPYQDGAAKLSLFRQGLSQAIETYRRGDHTKAETLLKNAELNALAGHLEVLRIRDSGLALGTEREVQVLRELVQESVAMNEIEIQAQAVAASLDRAEPLLGRELGGAIAAAQTASISMAFAVDGALCLFLLLALARRRGSDRTERRAVELGALAGIALTIVCWLMWGSLGAHLTGQIRSTLTLLFSTVVGLLAIPLLLTVVHHFKYPPTHRLAAPLSWLAMLFVLSGGLLFRDALEIMPSMLIVAQENPVSVLGFLGASMALIGMVALLVLLERRLAVASRVALLCVSITIVAVMAIGGAARAAQQLDFLGANAAGVAQSPLFGLWPTEQGVLLQLVVAAACALTIAIGTLASPQT